MTMTEEREDLASDRVTVGTPGSTKHITHVEGAVVRHYLSEAGQADLGTNTVSLNGEPISAAQVDELSVPRGAVIVVAPNDDNG